MKLEIGEVRCPDEGREVVADAEVDRLAAGEDPFGPHPSRPMGRALLLVEVLPVYAVGIALQRRRAAAQMGQHVGRDARVVVDHLAFCEARRRVHHLVEVGQAEPVAVDLDLHTRRGHAA